MSIHLQREMDSLRKRILSLGALVENNFQLAINSLSNPQEFDYHEVLQGDDEIDAMEVEVEEDCLKILALHQPVAADLRYLVCVLKLNNDLERIGDLAVNLSKKVKHIKTDCVVKSVDEVVEMAQRTKTMLNSALDALVNMDTDLARSVHNIDDEIDNRKKEIRVTMENAIEHDPANAKTYLSLLSAARNIERIADLSTNICEDVIYSADGEIVRHKL